MTRAQELFQRLVNEGETAIDELIADRTSEELFLDFKASPDNGAGTKLAHSDREKLAKAISGFGNSEGGVIVWGVDCDRLLHDGDVARAKRPVQNPKRFKSWLEAAVSGCTLPPHEGSRDPRLWSFAFLHFDLETQDTVDAVLHVELTENVPPFPWTSLDEFPVHCVVVVV